MIKFIAFLLESSSVKSPVVFSFGRMNPPTTGHQKLIDKVHSLAKKHNAEHSVVISHSHDAKKNPLTAEQKLKHAKRSFPGTNITTSTKEDPSYLHHAAKLHKAGHDHLIMVAGSDRVDDFKKTLHKYNGTGEGKLYNYKKISVVSSGARDPDAEGTEGMSASKMREHVKKDDFHSFKSGVSSHMSHEHAKEMFHDVKKGMEKK